MSTTAGGGRQEKPTPQHAQPEGLEPPKEILSLSEKAFRIAQLAVGMQGTVPAETFLGMMTMRTSQRYRHLRSMYPDEPERLTAARKTLKEDMLAGDTKTVNDWLDRQKHPELKLTVEEVLRIMYGD